MLRYMTSTGRLLLQPSSKISLVISASVLSRLIYQRQITSQQPESGGVLMGRLFGEGTESAIEALTEPGKGDRQSRFSFFRSARHQREVKAYWRRTEGEGTYMGLWHTHPEGKPTPSGPDKADWLRALRKDVFHSEGLLFVIVGTETIGFWYGKSPRSIYTLGNFEIDDHVENLFTNNSTS